MGIAKFYPTLSDQFSKRPLLFILLLSLAIRAFYLLFQHPLWWDAHVYIGIGKYIFSGGKIGIWESFRPLVHPLILGVIWKIGLSPVFFGKILDLVFSLLTIYLTYLLGSKIFNQKTAIISSIILSLSPLFMMFTGLILTEPLAMVLALWGIYLLVMATTPEKAKGGTEKETTADTDLSAAPFCLWKVFLSGILLGISFLTKFPQGVVFGAVILVLFFKKEPWALKIKKLFFMGIGFILALGPYMVFNCYRYPNPLEPFISGSWIVTTATWLYGSGIFYYFIHFFLAAPIMLFFFGYLYYFVREKELRSWDKNLLLLIPVLTLAYFLYVPRKEVRYMVTILPFLSLLASFTIIRIHQKLREKNYPIIRPKAFAVICAILIITYIPASLYFERAPSFEQEINKIIQENNLTGTILTTDPSFVSYLDNPIVILSGMDFGPAIYDKQKGQYQLLFIDDCNLLCAPDDIVCSQQKERFLKKIALENRLIYQDSHIFNQKSKTDQRTCHYLIFLPNQSTAPQAATPKD